ncbi:hypothetical protein NQ315_007556 [Exocentrus adspersus]|uniref:Uncharacterized protein n=1 Tax=Exocentrus adspersus TaxID=1586481 RepID=A0AAV8W9T0_9CUCU|nr:hypothetical protein NQ315_007556 [Exocentrus adspersus]
MKEMVFVCSLIAIASTAPSGGYGGHGGGVVVSGPSGVVTDHGAFGPSGPGGFGYGGYGGFGGFGGYGGDGGYGGYGGYGGHGVVIRGPPTVPATIVGPAGKIVANGLYGGHGW